jgi:hypothetical protein
MLLASNIIPVAVGILVGVIHVYPLILATQSLFLVRFFLNKQVDSAVSQGLQIICQSVSAVRRWTSKRQHPP